MDLGSYEEISFEFPFLSGLIFRGIEYIGIIQNSDDKIISFYDYESLRTEHEKKHFISLGETWWWESNRLLPINIFLRGEMEPYRYCLKSVIQKDTDIIFGPITSLDTIYKKRIKRRQIQLVRRVD
jgi:hypothetical protein